MKKIISLILVFLLITSQFLFADGSKGITAGKYLYELGVIVGDGKGNLGENSNITREQALLIMLRLMGLEQEAAKHSENHGFIDVPSGNFYAPYIAYARENGLTTGISNEKFGLGESVNAEAFLSYILRAFGNTADWSKEDVFKKGASFGLLKDVNTTRTDDSSRGETFIIMKNAIANLEKAMGYDIKMREEYESAISKFNMARKNGEPLDRKPQLSNNLKDAELIAAYPQKGNEIRLVFRQKNLQKFTENDVKLVLEDHDSPLPKNLYTCSLNENGDGLIRFNNLSLFEKEVSVVTLAGDKHIKFGKAPDMSEPEVIKSSTRLNRDIVLKFNDRVYSVGGSQFIGRDNFSVELDGKELDMNNFSVAPTSDEVTLTQLKNDINLYNKTVTVKYRNLARSLNYESENIEIPMSEEKSLIVGFNSVDHPKYVNKTVLSPREYVLSFERLTYGEAKNVSVYVDGKKLEEGRYGVSSSGNNVYISIRTPEEPNGKVEIEYRDFIDVATQVKGSQNKVVFESVKSSEEEKINISAENTGKLVQNVAKGDRKDDKSNNSDSTKNLKIPKFSYDISEKLREHRIYFDDSIETPKKENIKYRTSDGTYLDKYGIEFMSEDEAIYDYNGNIQRTIKVNYALVTIPYNKNLRELDSNLKDGFKTPELICELHGIKDKKTGGEMPYMEFKVYFEEVIN